MLFLRVYKQRANKLEQHVLLPLQEDASEGLVKFERVTYNKKEYLKIPKGLYEEYKSTFPLERLAAVTFFSSQRCEETKLDKLLPKPPWQSQLDEYETELALRDAKEKGIKLPGE